MKERTPASLLLRIYDDAMSIVGAKDAIESDLSTSEVKWLDILLQYSEKAKGVLTVIATSILYKILNPEQDIRNHQAGIPNGYSGRGFDTKYVTPFFKSVKFPYMSTTGWLTRSLEQPRPFDLTFPGNIQPGTPVKEAFLNILKNIEEGANCEEYLSYLFQGLIIKRNKQSIDLAKPTALTIDTILDLLNKHFDSSYKAEGASRLPVLAIYAAYQCLIKEVKRFEQKQLLGIESHTSSDKSSGRIGDIDIIDEKSREFEAVEVKYGIAINMQLVQDAFAKFQTTPVNRYYILSTVEPTKEEKKKIEEEIKRIKNIHGCQLIVNGIMPTLKYYLRLLSDTFEFINNYVNLLEDDTALKFEHKEKWNKIISEMK